ncbi:Ribonucleoside-diphosphate reductase subunit beta [Tritrichomonas foetus]|uniref:Ribonucleoside-diphosphate reductase subunit beta n=1 Tax=Tritrichomonas foetus TaxID=1144522 RepID=A0A1J4K611_9EUKA|nr:Ribonucleoside-diphosphate reductase subunit beta [Tritrichomonas foetus]|eukprot:OHT05126.1 Ribonucleoside-diphosphate reductase subunit beta [Tritrichomonas foetus]
MTVGRVVTNPEFEECLAWWDTFEVLHSRSYSHIIQGIFDNPSPVFDDILVNEFIIKRSQTCIRYYDELEEATNEYAVRRNTNPMVGEDLDFLKERILLALVNVNILEGIRFYVSFACSFAFGENKLMVGNASIIKLIATDECQHLILSQYLLKILQSNENEGFVELWNRNIETIREMYRVAFEEEKEWASYLFKDEAMLGLNEPILVEYLKHILYQRMAAIDLEPIVEEIKENPIPWIDNWLHYGNVETLPQETENIAYTIGTLKSEIKIDDLEFL